MPDAARAAAEEHHAEAHAQVAGLLALRAPLRARRMPERERAPLRPGARGDRLCPERAQNGVDDAAHEFGDRVTDTVLERNVQIGGRATELEGRQAAAVGDECDSRPQLGPSTGAEPADADADGRAERPADLDRVLADAERERVLRDRGLGGECERVRRAAGGAEADVAAELVVAM